MRFTVHTYGACVCINTAGVMRSARVLLGDRVANKEAFDREAVTRLPRSWSRRWKKYTDRQVLRAIDMWTLEGVGPYPAGSRLPRPEIFPASIW